MSFGFSIGDFVAVGQLAWQVYRKCKSAPSEFKAISSQLISLHIVYKDVNETIEEWGLSESKKGDLLQIADDSIADHGRTARGSARRIGDIT
jgi:hypothetical protein